MNEEKHKKMVSGFWGKILTVIIIPFVVYHCAKSDDNQTISSKTTDPFNDHSDIEDQRRRVNELITNGRPSILEEDSL